MKDIDPKTGELVGRRDMTEGKQKDLCPAIAGGISWNAGAYNPQTGLYYKIGNEWCMDLDGPEDHAGDRAAGAAQYRRRLHASRIRPAARCTAIVDARDPVTGKKTWSVDYPEPPLASLLSTAGGWCSCPTRAAGCMRSTPRPARSCGRPTTAPCTMAASSATRPSGKQYIAVVTGGPEHGQRRLSGDVRRPYKNMEKDTGVLIVYTLNEVRFALAKGGRRLPRLPCVLRRKSEWVPARFGLPRPKCGGICASCGWRS